MLVNGSDDRGRNLESEISSLKYSLHVLVGGLVAVYTGVAVRSRDADLTRLMRQAMMGNGPVIILITCLVQPLQP